MNGRKILLRVVVSISTVALTLVAAELALRFYHAVASARTGTLEQQLERSRDASLANARSGGRFTLKGLVQPSSHPELVFELKPGLDGSFRGRRLVTNSWGFRGEEVELQKLPGTVRIVGLGDSFMFGWGVEQEETYLARLESLLNARSEGRVEVLNLAVPGYNTTMEVAALEARGLAFEPDLVVLHFFRNDFELPYFMQREKSPAARRLYLAELLRRVFDSGEGGEADGARLVARDRVARATEETGDLRSAYRHMAGEEGFRRAMARLSALARERAIPVVVILFDETWHGDVARDVSAAEGLHVVEPRERFLAHLQQNQLDASQWEETFHVAARDIHLNALGHSLVADALAEFVTDRGLLPSAP